MEKQKEYSVLKIIVHSERCYMSTDYIRGEPLIVWLKYHREVSKVQFYQWIHKILKDLEHFHRCKGSPVYQYLNPYSILVGEDRQLHLLDLGNKEQEDVLQIMQRRYVRENFLSPDNQYYQNVSVSEDIYGVGRTLQYILTNADINPKLGRLETLRFRKMISRCLKPNQKKSYQEMGDIVHDFGEIQGKERKHVNSKVLAAGVVLVVGIAAGTIIIERPLRAQFKEKEGGISSESSNTDDSSGSDAADYLEEIRTMQEQWDEEKQELEDHFRAEERRLTRDMALMYFLDLEDYKSSREILGELEGNDVFEEDFIRLCTFMEEPESSMTEEAARLLLERLIRELPDAEDERYASCVAKGKEALEIRLQKEQEDQKAKKAKDQETKEQETTDEEANVEKKETDEQARNHKGNEEKQENQEETKE